MNAKQYLAKHYALGRRIMIAEMEIRELREVATAIGSFSYDQDRVKHSPEWGAKYESTVEQIADKCKVLEKDMRKWMSEQKQVEKIINSVEDDRQRDVLYMRYVLHLRFEQIAEELNYSIDGIFRLHRKGMKQVSIKIQ